MNVYGKIEEVNNISPRVFNEYYVKRNIPVIIKGFLSRYGVAKEWSFDYLEERLNDKEIPLKKFSSEGQIDISKEKANQYFRSILEYENRSSDSIIERPAYCHDIPIFHIAEELIADVKGLPSGFFPSWYDTEWWKYAQFFAGPSGSITPLHFDTLMTNNLFFQVKGIKEFFLLPNSEEKFCDRRGWRWFDLDPTQLDHECLSNKEKIHISKVVVEAGDLLYLPPGTLHHVVSVEASVSFNVDFHTKISVAKAIFSYFNKIPMDSMYYNILVFLGLICKVPSNVIFKFYKSYLNYVS